MQTQEAPKENAVTGKRSAHSGDDKKIAATTESRPSSSATRDFRFTKFGDVKIYDLIKAREGKTGEQFPQILFVGDSRFILKTKNIKNKCGSDIKVYEKSGLTLDNIKNFLSSQDDVDFSKRTLLICSIGAFDTLPTDEGCQNTTFDLGQKGKDVKTTLCQLFTENCIVLFLPILPIDFTRKLCGQTYAQCKDDEHKEAIKWGFGQICLFNEVLYSSHPKEIRAIMGKFYWYSFESFIEFTQTSTNDGIQLKTKTSFSLSLMVANYVKFIKQGRYENVIFVGDMRLEDFAKASPNWQDGSCGIKMLCGFNHKLSRIDKNGSVLRELRSLKWSLVVFVLGMSDLYEIYSSVCQGCGRNVKFPVVKTFAVPLSDLVSQIYLDMCKAERSLRDATQASCEVAFSMCYPVDIISCQEYWIREHLKICSNVNIIKPLSSSPIAVEKMTKDSARLIEILNRVCVLHSVKNKIVSWDPLQFIYGEDYTKRSSPESRVADIFRDGVNFTPDKLQSMAEQLFNNIQHMNLLSGPLRIKWMFVNQVVVLKDLISDCNPQGMPSNSANIHFSQKMNSSNGTISKKFPCFQRKPLLPSPQSSCSSIPNWIPPTAHYNQGSQYYMQSPTGGGQCNNAYPSLPSNPYLVFHEGCFYYTNMPADGYSTQQAYSSVSACHYSSNPNVAQTSHQQYIHGSDVLGGLQQNKTGGVSGSECQLSTYGEWYYSAYSTQAKIQYQTHHSIFPSSSQCLVNSDMLLPSVHTETRSSSSVTSGKDLVSSESKVWDESKAAIGTLQQHGFESSNTQSRMDDEGDKTPLLELGIPHTHNVSQLSKKTVEIHDKSMQKSVKGDAVVESQPTEVVVEEKEDKTSFQDICRRMEVCENPMKILNHKAGEKQTVSPDLENVDVTKKSSLFYELGGKNGKNQSYLSILKQTNVSDSTQKFQRRNERCVSSIEKIKEKENQDFDEYREKRKKSSISGNKSDTENLYFSQEEHISKSSDSDNPANCKYAKQSKVNDKKMSLLSSSRDLKTLSHLELPNNYKREDTRCLPPLKKRLKREHDEHREKRENKGTADVFHKMESEYYSHSNSYEEDLETYENALFHYLNKLKANQESLSIDNVTFLDDYAKEVVKHSKELGNKVENQEHDRDNSIPYNKTPSVIGSESNDLCSNLMFNSCEPNQEIYQLPIGKANEIIDILEALRNFGDDLGTLKTPLDIMYEKILKLKAEHLDVSRILKEDDNLTLFSRVLHKLEQINNSIDQSIVQKIILEEVSERLAILLKNNQ